MVNIKTIISSIENQPPRKYWIRSGVQNGQFFFPYLCGKNTDGIEPNPLNIGDSLKRTIATRISVGCCLGFMVSKLRFKKHFGTA